MAVDTYPDLFWAYTAVWVIVVLYVALMGTRLARLERLLRYGRQSQARDAGFCDSKR
jgi:CcmD family protein